MNGRRKDGREERWAKGKKKGGRKVGWRVEKQENRKKSKHGRRKKS